MPETLAPLDVPGATRSALEQWLVAYGAAWEGRDGDAAAALFTENATYQWGPFDAPLHGRAAIADRWNATTRDQRDVHFEHSQLAVVGDVAFVHWRASFVRLSTVAQVTLDGIFVLRFDAHGLCSELREWWLAA